MMFKATRFSFPNLLFLNLISILSIIISITDAIPIKTFPSANLTTLHLVQIISRHGDRSPILPYPNDLYKMSSIYGVGTWGELTELGASQTYELGVFLRRRYDGFLPRKYRKRDFLMMSSDIDRAIMSAEAILAGLYALGPILRSRDIFKEWQPVPIHTVAESSDNFINGKAYCPRYVSLYKQFLVSEEFNNFLTENKPFIDFIIDKSGLSSSAIEKDFSGIFQVQDALRCQHLHNLTLPTWANSTVLEKLDYFKALSFVWNVKTTEMQRLKVGILLEKLQNAMNAKVEAAQANLISEDENEEIPPYQDPIAYRKMFFYSSHDSTIAGILTTLLLYNPPSIPTYASALILELHKDPVSEQFYVELFYRNDSLATEPIHFDPLTFCGAPVCSLEKFFNITSSFIPANWENECQLQSSSSLTQISSSRGAKNLTLMRKVPVDVLNSILGYDVYNDQNPAATNTPIIHPLGMSAPGLSGFLLTVVSVTSLLLAFIVLLTSLLRCKNDLSFSPACSPVVYQHLRQ